MDLVYSWIDNVDVTESNDKYFILIYFDIVCMINHFKNLLGPSLTGSGDTDGITRCGSSFWYA